MLTSISANNVLFKANSTFITPKATLPAKENSMFCSAVAKLTEQLPSVTKISKKTISSFLFLCEQEGSRLVTPNNKDQKRLNKLFLRKIPYQFNLELLDKIIAGSFREQGYWHCNVRSLLEAKKLYIIINRGPHFIINKLIITATRFTKNLQAIFDSKKAPTNLTPSSLETNRCKALIFLRRAGFWNAQISFEPQLQHSSKKEVLLTINVIVKIGQRAKFGEINFVGNRSIKTELISKQIPFKQGDFWDSSLLHKTKSNLESLGVFDNIQLLCGYHPIPSENFVDTSFIPVTIELTEALPHEFKFLCGLTSNSKIFSDFKPDKLFNFKAGVCFAKKNFLLHYDEATIAVDFNLEKGAIKAAYNYGKLKNFPFDITISAYKENQTPLADPKENEENADKQNAEPIPKKLAHTITSLNCNLSKKNTQDFYIGSNIGLLSMDIKNANPLKKPNNFYYAIASLDLSSENIQGSWLNEKGVILTASNKLMFDLASTKRSFGKFLFFGTFFTPINSTLSVANKVGVVVMYPLTRQSAPLDLTNLANTKYLTDADPLLINGVMHQPYQHHFLEVGNVHDIIKSNEKAIYAAIELRKLLNNHIGITAFCNLKITPKKKAQFLVGIGGRFGAHLSSIFFDFGWDSQAQNIFWRMKIGAF